MHALSREYAVRRAEKARPTVRSGTATGYGGMERTKMRAFEIHIGQPRALEATRLEEVLQLITEGGEVNPATVSSRLSQAVLTAYATIAGKVVATASIKRPTDDDYENAFVRADSPLSYRDYPCEFGYAVVASAFRKQQLGSLLWKGLIRECSSMNLFATVRGSNVPARKLLSNCGFKQSGSYFRSRNGVDELLLFVREAMIDLRDNA